MTNVNPLIEINEEGLGPCMLALNPAQRAYVVARVFMGLNQTKSAEAAGYSASTADVAKSNGYRLEHDERIQAAVAEECRKLMRSEGAQSVRTLVKLRDDPSTKPADRIKAAQALLDRCGLGSVSEHHHLVEHTDNRSADEIMTGLVKELADMLRLPEKFIREQMLDPSRKIIDAEFQELPPTEKVRARDLERENELRRLRVAMTPEELAAHKQRTNEQRSAQGRARYAVAQQTDDDLADLFGDDDA